MPGQLRDQLALVVQTFPPRLAKAISFGGSGAPAVDEADSDVRSPPHLIRFLPATDRGPGTVLDAAAAILRKALVRARAPLYINSGMRGWTVETLNATVTAEIRALAEDVQARLRAVMTLIEQYGLPAVGMPHVRHIEGRLWEIRAKGRDGIARALYVTTSGRRVVVVRVFVKKTQKAPRREIELALQRARAVA